MNAQIYTKFVKTSILQHFFGFLELTKENMLQKTHEKS